MDSRKTKFIFKSSCVSGLTCWICRSNNTEAAISSVMIFWVSLPSLIFYRIFHIISLILIYLGIIYLSRVLIIVQIIKSTADDSATMVDTLLRTAVVKKIFLLQPFYDLCWHVISMLWYLDLHTFLYLMCVCELCTIFLHWITYVIKFWRYCSFLIGYQVFYLFFTLIYGISDNRSFFLNRKKYFNFFKGVWKKAHR